MSVCVRLHVYRFMHVFLACVCLHVYRFMFFFFTPIGKHMVALVEVCCHDIQNDSTRDWEGAVGGVCMLKRLSSSVD